MSIIVIHIFINLILSIQTARFICMLFSQRWNIMLLWWFCSVLYCCWNCCHSWTWKSAICDVFVKIFYLFTNFILYFFKKFSLFFHLKSFILLVIKFQFLKLMFKHFNFLFIKGKLLFSAVDIPTDFQHLSRIFFFNNFFIEFVYLFLDTSRSLINFLN